MENVEFYLEKSRLLGLLLISIYGGSLSVLYLIEISFIYKIILIGFVMYFLQKNWNMHVSKKNQHAIIKIWQDSKGQWGFENRRGQGYKAKMLPDTFKSRFLIILRFRTALKTYNILVLCDALRQNEYRTLCRHLMFC